MSCIVKKNIQMQQCSTQQFSCPKIKVTVKMEAFQTLKSTITFYCYSLKMLCLKSNKRKKIDKNKSVVLCGIKHKAMKCIVCLCTKSVSLLWERQQKEKP